MTSYTSKEARGGLQPSAPPAPVCLIWRVKSLKFESVSMREDQIPDWESVLSGEGFYSLTTYIILVKNKDGY